ncbi:hypothetical protein AB1Y20_004043 [Prymnesium parvum]|uniref:adenosine deaminase n=1 Tax=Prymnesium parvum TaxID=97485 RepID=A0AB34J9G0_PRYPA
MALRGLEPIGALARRHWLTMPKVELHVHLDGAFDQRLLFEAARRRLDAGTLPPAVVPFVANKSLEDFSAQITCLPSDRSLRAMIDKFMIFLPIVQGQLPLLEQLAHAFVSAQAAQHVVYAEVRYSPHILTDNAAYGHLPAAGGAAGCTARQVVEAVTRGLRRGCEEHAAVDVRQILCFIDGRPEYCAELTELAAEFQAERPCGVVGVDVAAGEEHFADSAEPAEGVADGQLVAPAEAADLNGATHRAALRCCAAVGLAVTLHAAESGPAANVAAAVSERYGGARRVGHGYKAVAAAVALCEPCEAAPMAAALGKLGVPPALTLECCPTSSFLTSGWDGSEWKQHPAAVLHKLQAAEGAPPLPKVTLSSDDPSVFGTSLTDELMLAADEKEGMGMGVHGVHQCALNAVDAAFLDEDERRALRARFEEAWAAWESTLK